MTTTDSTADTAPAAQTQLTVVPEYSTTAAALMELREKHQNLVLDVTTTKGMTEAREARAEIKAYRVNLEKMRVEIKAPALERCRVIDAEAKRITAELLALETPIDEAIKAQEAIKEKERAVKAEAERERLAQIERERLAAERAEAERVQAERAAALAAERAQLAADRAEFERQQAEAAAAEVERRQEADMALASARAAEAARVAAERVAENERLAVVRQQHEDRLAEERRQAEAERERIAQERALEHEARMQKEREETAERARLAGIERERLTAERKALDERQDKERQAAFQAHLETLRTGSTDLMVAAIDAHKFLVKIQDGEYANEDVTLALGFAIEHNAEQRQLPLESAAKKPTTKKGAKA